MSHNIWFIAFMSRSISSNQLINIFKNYVILKFLTKTWWTWYGLEILLGNTVNSRFKKVQFSFLKSRVVWFEKDSDDFWQLAINPKLISATTVVMLVQSTLNLRNPIFPFLNRELFDLRKIYVVILKTGHPKTMSYVGESASWDLS